MDSRHNSSVSSQPSPSPLEVAAGTGRLSHTQISEENSIKAEKEKNKKLKKSKGKVAVVNII